jgi:hypothetical protein
MQEISVRARRSGGGGKQCKQVFFQVLLSLFSLTPSLPSHVRRMPVLTAAMVGATVRRRTPSTVVAS